MRGAKVNIWRYIEEIKPYLQRGFSINRACILGEIPSRTVLEYYEKDSEVREKIDMYKEHASNISRAVWLDEIMENKNWQAARDYLELTDKDFRKKTESKDELIVVDEFTDEQAEKILKARTKSANDQ